KRKGPSVTRRSLLKGAAVAGAAAATAPLPLRAQTAATGATRRVSPPDPEIENYRVDGSPIVQTTSGSDFMLDVLKTVGFEYAAATCGSSFKGLHESIVNYGKNTSPEWLATTHEETSVAIAHGYAKIENKPMLVCAHGTVGLQHASMALYDAFCDRVPVFMIVGNTAAADARENAVHWVHSSQDDVAMVRDFVKWDDKPASLQHFAESAVRAYKIATTPPMAPVVLCADTEMQEGPIPEGEKPTIPKLPATAMPQGESGAVAEVAKLLVAAENPIIVAESYGRSQAAVDHLVELAELLQCGVIDVSARMNFPTRHPLNQTSRGGRGTVGQADVVLGLEVVDFWGVTHQFREHIVSSSRPTTKPGAKIVSISSGDLFIKSNFQNFQRFEDVDLAIAADAATTMPSLIEACKREMTAAHKASFSARGAKLGEAHKAALERVRSEAAYGWDASPVSTARLSAELFDQLRHEDWSLASTKQSGISNWPQRLWAMDKYYHYTGESGGNGIGFGAAGAVGAALANKKHGRITVTIQPDGDLMMGPGILWTAAHHKIPILYVMHNNRAWHQEYMGLQKMANRRMRGADSAHIGTTIRTPFIDYATVAKGMGVYAEGPIENPKDLGPALKRAIAMVKRGEPALLDVITIGR
ncbi:MAG TPA: thiamine pyrophosphate-dependent enzyme, partial [Micropepsaceae bacterium]|nr:thiamine pyrophosphate-dependent enzyme [Micropepsaceae bacterium]